MIMRISLIIITKNRPKELYRCLSSVFKQSILPTEVIVVYNRTSDLVLLKKLPLKLETIFCSQANKSIARNMGIRKAKGDLLVFLDDDCVVKKNWLTNIVDFFKNNPRAKIVMGNNQSPINDDMFSRMENQDLNNWFKQHLIEGGQKAKTMLLDSKNFAVRQAFLVSTNVHFDLRFKNYYEDIDFGWQIWSRGEPIYYDANIKAVHYGRSSLFNHMIREVYLGIGLEILLAKWRKNNKDKLIKTLITSALNQKQINKESVTFWMITNRILRSVGRFIYLFRAP